MSKHTSTLLTAVLVLLVVTAGIATAATLFEGFEDGSYPSGFSESIDEGSIQRVNTTSYEGSWSLEITHGGGTGTSTTWIAPSTATYDRVTFAWRVTSYGGNLNSPSVVVESPEGQSLDLTTDSSGELYLKQQNVGTNISISKNTWYLIQLQNIQYDTDTFDLVVKDASGTLVGRRNDTSFAIGTSGVSNLQFNDPSVSGESVFIDNLEVTNTTTTTTQADADNLTFDVRNYMNYNKTHPYTVYAYNNTTDETTDVTQNATLTIENVTLNGTQVLTSPSKGTLETINDSNVNATVNLSVDYDGMTQNATVVVAAPTVENLEILPDAFVRAQAVFGDSTLFALMIAAILAVAVTRFTNSFAGLATSQVIIVIGWFAGYVGIGITMLSVFVAIFIGLNLAENTTQLRRAE